MLLKLHARQICYTKLLGNKLNVDKLNSNCKHDRNHSWHRGVLEPPILWRPPPPPRLPNPPFSNFVHPPSQLPLTPIPTANSVALFLWLSKWSPLLWCAILLNDIMDVHMPSLRTLMHVLGNKASSFIVCIGVLTTLQKHHLLFFIKQLLKSTNCSSPSFFGIPPYTLVFHEPPTKNWIF